MNHGSVHGFVHGFVHGLVYGLVYGLGHGFVSVMWFIRVAHQSKESWKQAFVLVFLSGHIT